MNKNLVISGLTNRILQEIEFNKTERLGKNIFNILSENIIDINQERMIDRQVMNNCDVARIKDISNHLKRTSMLKIGEFIGENDELHHESEKYEFGCKEIKNTVYVLKNVRRDRI